MSSIAYVTDEEMLEYHRLCRNRTILFWRLASRKKFSDFRKGDLLFFFSRPHNRRKKGLVGYAHYDSTKRLSLKQMWEQYGPITGYDTQQRLNDSIARAAKNDIPRQMRCLYLTDVVFFTSPVYPEDIDLDIPANLESYTYLDRSDPEVTVRILEKAKHNGIDLWSADPDVNPDEIFRNDMTRHQLAVICRSVGREAGSEKERSICHKLASEKVEEKNWEMIRGSISDCLFMDKNRIIIGIPFAPQANDRDLRIRELYGKIVMYKLSAEKLKMERTVSFEILTKETDMEAVLGMVDELNHV
jgi:hypothetical protein